LVLLFVRLVRGSAVILVRETLIGSHVAVVGAGFSIPLLAFLPARAACLHWALAVIVGVKFTVRMVSRKVAPVSSVGLIFFHDNAFFVKLWKLCPQSLITLGLKFIESRLQA